jgi:hypothetical protein
MFLAEHAASVALKEGARGDDEVTVITSWGNHLEGNRRAKNIVLLYPKALVKTLDAVASALPLKLVLVGTSPQMRSGHP